MVLVSAAPALDFFQDEGLSVRDLRTSEVVPLKQGRNDLARGDYRVEQANPPAGVRIFPRQFTVTAGTTVIVNVTHTPAEKAPPVGAETPPERPPLPPPFEGPPPPPPRPRR